MYGSKYSGYRGSYGNHCNWKKEQSDFEWAVKLNRIALDLIGLWPITAQNPRQKLLCDIRVLVVFLGVTLGVLIPSMHSLIRIHGDIMLMIDNLQFTLPAVSCSIRIVIFWWKKEAIIPIMDMIAEDWVRSKSARERRMMIRRARSARIIIICAYCIMGVACIFIIVLPGFGVSMRLTPNITDPGRPMPLQTHYIYDVTRRPQYELTFISQAVYILLAIMSYTGIDNFLGLLIFHMCGQLDILTNRLAHLDKCTNSRDMLKNCVAKHVRLLRAIDVIEDTYNITLLALFLYFAILFAFYGFRIISCNEIYYAAYSNKWYSVDSKNAKDLLPLLIRSAKPIYLTAGKVFPITMATFCGLIKTSAGYISVLHTTRN
ncbi:odorant receptor 13a-like isoform X3 [Polyergus mexicanus]|uniref:odorant receptor 13a-like isoform X3 n=1 Tax=Polyergus mexicanus TaxID=615972 RepID=UPI0038B62F5A